MGVSCTPEQPATSPPKIFQTNPVTLLPTNAPIIETSIAFPTIPPLPTSTPDRRILTPVAAPLIFKHPTKAEIADQNTMEKIASITFLGQNAPLLWESGWCAQSPQILDENIQHLEFRHYVNGEEIPADYFSQENILTNNQEESCRIHSLLLEGFQRGKYELKQQILIQQTINDGKETFPIGVKETPFLIYVSESQLFENEPLSSWLQLDSQEILSFWTDRDIQDEWMKAQVKKTEAGLAIQFEEVYKNSILRLPPITKVISTPLYYEFEFESIPYEENNCYGIYTAYQYTPMSFNEFEFCTNGEFSIQRYAKESWETLAERQKIHFPALPSKVRLGVLLDQENSTFYINGEAQSEIYGEKTNGYFGVWVKAIEGNKITISQPLIKLP